jgi:psiF repeat
MKRNVLLAGAVALAISLTGALAQDAGKTKAKASAKPRTAISIECSKQADAKKLHGKERQNFRGKCKRDAEKAAKAKQ